MPAVCVGYIAVNKNGGESVGIDPLSKWSADVVFNATGGGAVPRVGNLAGGTLTAIEPIWVCAFMETNGTQGASR